MKKPEWIHRQVRGLVKIDCSEIQAQDSDQSLSIVYALLDIPYLGTYLSYLEIFTSLSSRDVYLMGWSNDRHNGMCSHFHAIAMSTLLNCFGS